MQEKPLKVVVIGGDAAGMSAASQIKRRIKTAEVIVLEKTEDVSYGACGMPYNIGYNSDINDLIVMTADDFKQKRGIDVRLLNEVIGIDTDKKVVTVKNLVTSREYELLWDKLFIGTGAKANMPNIKGIHQDGIFSLKTLNDARKIKNYIEKKHPKKAVLIGGGFINLELADNFKKLGFDIVILEKFDDIMLAYDEEIRQIIKNKLEENGVQLLTGVDINEIKNNLFLNTNKGEFQADIINISAGIKPNTEFLKNSKVKLERGAVVVDKFFRTNIENVFSGGDCALIYNRLLKRNVYLPLGTNANKAGKLAGVNMSGLNEEFQGIVGTTIFGLFGFGIAKTGLSLIEAEKEGFNAFKTIISAKTKAHGYPNQGDISIILIAEKNSGKILGAEIVGDGEASLRIDIISTAIFAGMTLKDLQSLDLAYSPPFAPVWDPILVCANQAIKGVNK